MKTTKEKIEVMQAFEEGKPIQIRINKEDGKWFDFKETPHWNWEENDYRIKPELIVEAKPVVHGHWINDLSADWKCSVCGFNESPSTLRKST
mgnify:CR=1 FL=1